MNSVSEKNGPGDISRVSKRQKVTSLYIQFNFTSLTAVAMVRFM